MIRKTRGFKYHAYICCLLFVFCLLSPAISFAATSPVKFEVTGLSGEPLQNVNSRLALAVKNFHSKPTKHHITDLSQEIPKIITEALEPYGYFKSTISVGEIQKKGKQWLVKCHVEPGEVMHVSEVDIVISGPGKNNKAIQHYIQHFPVKAGDVALAERYTRAKQRLYSIVISAGYLKPDFTKNQLIIDTISYSAKMILHLKTGRRYYFGKVTFADSAMDKNFLARYVNFKPGDVYNETTLTNLQQNLNGSGYFQQVTVSPAQGKAVDYQVPVSVALTMADSQQYRFGLGYGTDTGIRGTVGLNLPHVTSTGQNFKSLLTLSQIDQSLDAQYIIPGKNPVNQKYFISASVGQETPQNDSKGFLEKMGVGYQTQLGSWQQTAAIYLQNEKYNIRGGPENRAFLVLPSMTWTQSVLDDPIFPLHGNSITINVRAADKDLGSTTSFAQMTIRDQFIYSLGSANRFVLRGSLGYTAIKNLDELPLSLQYFMGGAHSLRGYTYQELGPGRLLVLASAEYQREVYDKWYLTFFDDLGNALDNFSCSNPANKDICGLKQTPGLGVMWASPIGPVEVAIAAPLNEMGKGNFSSWKISFTMGAGL